jgi:hypothetical protein
MVQVSSELEVQIVHVILTIWQAPTNPALRHIRFVVSCTGFVFFDLGLPPTGRPPPPPASSALCVIFIMAD